MMTSFPKTNQPVPVSLVVFFATITIFFITLSMSPGSVYGEDRLVVKNSSGGSTF